MSRMHPGLYGEGYWEHGQGSNYHRYGDDPGWEPTVAAITACVGSGGRWLEVGCAKGYFVAAARRHGIEATGVDLSRWAVSHPAPGMRPYVEHGDAMDLPVPDGAIDVLCSWEMLEHVPEEDLETVLLEMNRVVRPGGWAWHRIALEDGAQADHDHDETHFTIRPKAWWREVFRDMGWQQASFYEDEIDARFAGRDWQGRFFVYRVP